jgi:hypothetical protein
MIELVELYDPEKSRISEDALADFLRSTLTGDLTEVPGISRCAIRKLAAGDEKITNTFQLIGKFLLLKTNIGKTDEIINSKQHCDEFFNWLKLKGIQSYRSDIVMCIAEKTNTMVPGMYDAYEFN